MKLLKLCILLMIPTQISAYPHIGDIVPKELYPQLRGGASASNTFAPNEIVVIKNKTTGNVEYAKILKPTNIPHGFIAVKNKKTGKIEFELPTKENDGDRIYAYGVLYDANDIAHKKWPRIDDFAVGDIVKLPFFMYALGSRFEDIPTNMNASNTFVPGEQVIVTDKVPGMPDIYVYGVIAEVLPNHQYKVENRDNNFVTFSAAHIGKIPQPK